MVSEGKVRVDGTRISKPSRTVGAGDTLTFPQGRDIRVVRIKGLGERRGPSPEALALYDDLAPPEPKVPQDEQISKGARPTKRERRKLVESKRDVLE